MMPVYCEEKKKDLIIKLKRMFFYGLYYFGARRLPLSYAPGGCIWRKIRFVVCQQLLGSCGKNVTVETGARFYSGKTIFISDNSMIGENALLAGTVIIGKNVMMAPDVVMISRNHGMARLDIPMREQGLQPDRPIKVGDDVWIGIRVIILPGVSIGSGAVIGAGAVVTRDVPERAVVAGNPARVVRYRKDAR